MLGSLEGVLVGCVDVSILGINVKLRLGCNEILKLDACGSIFGSFDDSINIDKLGSIVLTRLGSKVDISVGPYDGNTVLCFITVPLGC